MKLFYKSKYNQRGFTLIELLVVISIISLLSSVILASVRDARDKAQQTAYRTYMNEVVKAIELYRSDVGNIDQIAGDSDPFVDDYIWNLKDVIQTGDLSSYISWQEPPSFLIVDPINIELYLVSSPISSATCEADTSAEFFLSIPSTRSDLRLPEVNNPEALDITYTHYCVPLP